MIVWVLHEKGNTGFEETMPGESPYIPETCAKSDPEMPTWNRMDCFLALLRTFPRLVFEEERCRGLRPKRCDRHSLLS